MSEENINPEVVEVPQEEIVNTPESPIVEVVEEGKPVGPATIVEDETVAEQFPAGEEAVS